MLVYLQEQLSAEKLEETTRWREMYRVRLRCLRLRCLLLRCLLLRCLLLRCRLLRWLLRCLLGCCARRR